MVGKKRTQNGDHHLLLQYFHRPVAYQVDVGKCVAIVNQIFFRSTEIAANVSAEQLETALRGRFEDGQ